MFCSPVLESTGVQLVAFLKLYRFHERMLWGCGRFLAGYDGLLGLCDLLLIE